MLIFVLTFSTVSVTVAEICWCPPPRQCPPTRPCSSSQCSSAASKSQSVPLCQPRYIDVRAVNAENWKAKSTSGDADEISFEIGPSQDHPPSNLPSKNVIGSKYRRRRSFERSVRQVEPFEDACNNNHLRKIIEENIVEGNASVSRSNIYKAFFDQAGARDQINVICSNAPLSYSVVSSTYCEATFKQITCILFHA
ncbi:hypothetical protein Tcan_15628 [Toxocara canis]|uniref:Ground-like domain-containing protein n=1 Tax=Toxocara canis TaxID=6265 RepID=A0A0B2VIW3_TOXCA|nr:hypothetical protein Tcan_15628 [Toxocara canis]